MNYTNGNKKAATCSGYGSSINYVVIISRVLSFVVTYD